MMAGPGLALTAVPGIAEIVAGDDLASVIARAMDAAAMVAREHDVIVISHKVVSKSEGRVRDLARVTVSTDAEALARTTGKDPRVVQVILDESVAIVRVREGLIIARHRNGTVMANAGIDQSNVGDGEPGERVLCLPEDADASATRIKAALDAHFNAHLGIVICDSVGRAWRRGVVGQAIGAAGLPSLIDLRGERDRQGRELRVTFAGYADGIAAAAELLMGEAAEGRPVVLVQGLCWRAEDCPASALIRTPEEDLFT